MEGRGRGDGHKQLPGKTGHSALFAGCAKSNHPLAVLRGADASVESGRSLFLSASLIFSDHFNMVIA